MNININLCRVCLKQGTGTNIYTGNILEKFRFTTLVQVEKNDGLSEIICKRCLARLQIAYDFKKEAISSNRELRSFISDVNNKFKQVTSSSVSAKVSKKRPRKESSQEGESYDELDDDMQDLIADEYRDIDGDLSDGNSKAIDREQLVEILGDNGSTADRKTRVLPTVKETSITIDDEPPESMEVFLVDENNEVDSSYVIYDYEQQPGGSMTDESEEPQFLEDDEQDNNDDDIAEIDENFDEIYEIDPDNRKTSQKSKSVSNAENRCDKCHKTFSTRTNLTRHKITHEGRKPYVCTICGNSFTQNGSLKSHMLIHTGERPFKCNVCGQGFTQSKSLTFHMRRHTGEKPFPCDYCGIRFRQKDCLKRHIVAKHAPDQEKQTFACNVCGKHLLCKYSLRMHLSRHGEQEIAAAEKKRKTSGNSVSSTEAVEVKDEDEKIQDTDDYTEEFACEFCEQTFTNSTDLLSHRDSHAELNEEHAKYIEDST